MWAELGGVAAVVVALIAFVANRKAIKEYLDEKEDYPRSRRERWVGTVLVLFVGYTNGCVHHDYWEAWAIARWGTAEPSSQETEPSPPETSDEPESLN